MVPFSQFILQLEGEPGDPQGAPEVQPFTTKAATTILRAAGFYCEFRWQEWRYKLISGEIDVVILLTGIGARILAQSIAPAPYHLSPPRLNRVAAAPVPPGEDQSRNPPTLQSNITVCTT
jgi:hypothetical protein